MTADQIAHLRRLLADVPNLSRLHHNGGIVRDESDHDVADCNVEWYWLPGLPRTEAANDSMAELVSAAVNALPALLDALEAQ